MAKPSLINSSLSWVYDLETFDYHKSYKIVIERVLERGNLPQWKEMIVTYNKEKKLKQLNGAPNLIIGIKNFANFS